MSSLANQYISGSFQKLMQLSGSLVLNGTGSLVTNLSVTSSFSNTSSLSLRIPISAPSSPTAGSIYFNTSSNQLFIHNGTTYRSASFS